MDEIVEYNNYAQQQNFPIIAENLTCIITNYNYGAFLAECIESVINGAMQPVKIVLVDDASDDWSIEVAERYLPLIEIVSNQETLGISRSCNNALEKVTTEWAFILDADNVVSPNYVMEFHNNLDIKRQNTVIAYTDMFIFGKKAEEFSKKIDGVNQYNEHFGLGYFWSIPNYGVQIESILSKENPIHGNSFFRVERFRNIGGMRPVKPEDHDLWKRMIGINSGFKATKLENALLGYRQHSDNQMQKFVESRAIISMLLQENIKLRQNQKPLIRFIYFVKNIAKKIFIFVKTIK